MGKKKKEALVDVREKTKGSAKTWRIQAAFAPKSCLDQDPTGGEGSEVEA